MLRALVLLRTACAQRNQLKPPLNDKNCHELVSGDYRNRPYLIYELKVGRVRVPWFYGEDRHTLIVTHCFRKSTQKASKAEQATAATVLRNYRDAHGASPQELRFIGE
ncbi:hypothetical protein AWB74_08455 [Caballeronia arvi]|uniref:Type II toxin-antitoxin system RelE/ParE family toxin n=1 Tax=Caballeronia arvi TaxID=1777135 RepID=A0A158L4J5_9BURK|nr:hypothetical protein AWB74_08455 [Caballeronia arvi]